MSFNGYDLQNHRGLEISNHASEANTAHYFYDPEGMKSDYQNTEEHEKPKQPPFPWRRYFARGVDLAIYSFVFDAVASIVFKLNLSGLAFPQSFLSTVISAIIMFLVEPVFLSKWGTTLGKWIWGITVKNKWGDNLTYQEARSRTFEILQYGYGFHIPIYSLVRMWKSYTACKNEEVLDWEYKSVITLKDKKGWRIGAFFGAQGIIHVLSGLFVLISVLPLHRGDITVKEFSENFNQYAKYYGMDYSGQYLDKNGQWAEEAFNEYGVDIFVQEETPQFQYIKGDGVLKGVTFEVHKTDGDIYTTYSEFVYLAAASFMRAQKGYFPVFDKTNELAELFEGDLRDGFDFSAYGVSIEYEIHAEGYRVSDNVCWPEGDKSALDITFKMMKEGTNYQEQDKDTSDKMEADDESDRQFDCFGYTITFPDNETWAHDLHFQKTDENHRMITYRDDITEADCALEAIKSAEVALDAQFDETKTEFWEAEDVQVELKYSDNGNSVYAIWQYDDIYFVIRGDFTGEHKDGSSVAKMALHIIRGL